LYLPVSVLADFSLSDACGFIVDTSCCAVNTFAASIVGAGEFTRFGLIGTFDASRDDTGVQLGIIDTRIWSISRTFGAGCFIDTWQIICAWRYQPLAIETRFQLSNAVDILACSAFGHAFCAFFIVKAWHIIGTI
jgi:hypothetical protein